MKNTFTAFLILACTQNASFAQQIGVILDSATHAPIAHASIYHLTSGKITFSNRNGEFFVDSGERLIRVTHLSYQGAEQLIPENDSIIVILKPSFRTLPEVEVLSNKKSVLEEIYRANTVRKSNVHEAEGFYRQINLTDDSIFSEIHEVFFTLLFTNQGIIASRMNHGRYGKRSHFPEEGNREREKIVAIRNFSSITKAARTFFTPSQTFGSSIIYPVSAFGSKIYDVSLLETFAAANDVYSVYECKLKKKTSGLAAYEGRLTVRERDLAIAKFEGAMAHPFGIASSMGKLYETREHLWTISIEYDLGTLIDKSRLKTIFVTHSFHYKHQKYAKWHRLKTASELFLFEYRNKGVTGSFTFNTKKELKKREVDEINSTTYDPMFWRNNSILKRTSFEDDIIQKFELNYLFTNLSKRY